MDSYAPHVILDVNASELDRAANLATAEAVAKRHADRLGFSTFIKPPGVGYTLQVTPTVHA